MPNTHRPMPRFVDALSTLSESASVLSSISPSLDERCFPSTLLSATIRTASTVTGTAKHITPSAIATERHSPVTPENIASCKADHLGYWFRLGKTPFTSYDATRNSHCYTPVTSTIQS
jgi:hypothetical protein